MEKWYYPDINDDWDIFLLSPLNYFLQPTSSAVKTMARDAVVNKLKAHLQSLPQGVSAQTDETQYDMFSDYPGFQSVSIKWKHFKINNYILVTVVSPDENKSFLYDINVMHLYNYCTNITTGGGITTLIPGDAASNCGYNELQLHDSCTDAYKSILYLLIV